MTTRRRSTASARRHRRAHRPAGAHVRRGAGRASSERAAPRVHVPARRHGRALGRAAVTAIRSTRRSAAPLAVAGTGHAGRRARSRRPLRPEPVSRRDAQALCGARARGAARRRIAVPRALALRRAEPARERHGQALRPRGRLAQRRARRGERAAGAAAPARWASRSGRAFRWCCAARRRSAPGRPPGCRCPMPTCSSGWRSCTAATRCSADPSRSRAKRRR